MASPIRFELRGVQQMKTSLLRLPDVILRQVERVLLEVAREILTVAQARTPVRSGRLRASAAVHPPQRINGAIVVALTFGNETVNYSLYVHEDLDVYHAPPTQAKFLETAMLESLPQLGDRIAAELRRQLGMTGVRVTARYRA